MALDEKSEDRQSDYNSSWGEHECTKCHGNPSNSSWQSQIPGAVPLTWLKTYCFCNGVETQMSLSALVLIIDCMLLIHFKWHTALLWCMPSARSHCVLVCDCKCPVKPTLPHRLQNYMQSFSVFLNWIAVSFSAVTVPPDKWMCGFSSVRPAACPRCCGGEAGFHLSSLFHTERERERNERLQSCLCLSI